MMLLGYSNENAVHVALKTVRRWLDKLTAVGKVSEWVNHWMCYCFSYYYTLPISQ